MAKSAGTTDPNAPTEGVHPTWEEAQAKIEDEIADYRAQREDEAAEQAEQAKPEPAPAPKASTSTSEKS